LRGVLILPEFRDGDLPFDLGQFTVEAGFVKGPSAARWRAR
jgi:hypothetical protein